MVTPPELTSFIDTIGLNNPTSVIWQMMRSGPHGALFEYIGEFLIKSKLISEGIASNLLVSESLR